MKTHRSGFILPTILIVGTVLLFVLAFVLETIATGRSAMRSSHFQLLARQAAESGVARAKACLMENNRLVTWTESSPLRPNTDCRGVVIQDADGNEMSPYLLNTEHFQSSFIVRPSDVDDTYKIVSAQGTLNILGQGGVVKRTYDRKLSAFIKTDVTFSDIVFGSLYVGSGYNDLYSRSGQTAGFSKAVYFFTKTHLGRISSVGYNMDGVLTGYNSSTAIPWHLRHVSDPKEWYHTPYSLELPTGNTVPVSKIFTDFQGNGWVAFFLGADGRTVHSTGSNINCDLGLGSCTPSSGDGRWSRPIWMNSESKMDLSNIPADEKIINIFYNASTFVLTDAGKLYASGTQNLSPGFGSGAASTISKPTLVQGYHDFNNQSIIAFYSDSYYQLSSGTLAAAATADGHLYVWGRGGYINNTDTIPRRALTAGYSAGGQTSGGIVDVVTDGGSVWALDGNGLVWSAGNNRYGQLGRGSSYSSVSSFGPVTIPGNKKIVKMAADGFSVLLLAEDGTVYGAGLNDAAQLGFPKSTETCTFSGEWWTTYHVPCSRSPRQFVLPDDKTARDIFIVSPATKSESGSGQNYQVEANRYRNSFVITTEGEVYGAGSNYHGQLGVGAPGDNDQGYGGSPQEFDVPQKMTLDNGNNESGQPGGEDEPVVAKYVRSGLGTTIVISDSNRVFTVGNNSTGQLGSGNTTEYHIPKRHRYTNMFQTWYY